MKHIRLLLIALGISAAAVPSAQAQWVTRDHRWPTRGPWLWALSRELPQLDREFNGIDFGHAHVAETLIGTQEPEKIERARLEVLDFIFSSPRVPPDEEQVAPTATKLVWEAQKVFHWSHLLHRSLWDLFASDGVGDKENAYRKILADYLDKPEAVTPHHLDHHGKLWGFPESKAFRNKFPKFNTQIWAYHWLQAAAYDVQLMGDAARQRELMPKIIEHYHGYLREPPTEWQFMPMFHEGAPEFSARFSEAAAIFDNMHMLHDNLDDVLSSPDLYPTLESKREAILRILPIYLHRFHVPHDRYAEYHMQHDHQRGGNQKPKVENPKSQSPPPHGKNLDADLKPQPAKPDSKRPDHKVQTAEGRMQNSALPTLHSALGPRPPSAKEVLEGKATPGSQLHAPKRRLNQTHQEHKH